MRHAEKVLFGSALQRALARCTMLWRYERIARNLIERASRKAVNRDDYKCHHRN